MESFPTAAALKLLAVSVVALGLANCSSAPRSGRVASAPAAAPAKVDPKYGVKPSPRVVAGNSKMPKGGGRAMVGKPYTVAGRKFTPRENDNYVAVGTASWYGAAFHGRKTANGEIFDKHSFAAAHPTLPLPSYVRVTNLSNQRSMIVRVNDRGPFHGNRLIDLSKNAAEALDFHRQGTARVKVEYMGRASLTGSDDRKLLATLNNSGPAAVPSVAPATRPAPAGTPAPVVTPAPELVMMASAEPAAVATPVAAEAAPPAVAAPAPAPVQTVAVEAIPAAIPPASRPLVSRTLVAPPAAPAGATEATPVAALPAPAIAPPARTLVAPQTMAFTAASQPANQATELTQLVQEVGAAEALEVPLPPSRPPVPERRRMLLSASAAGEEAAQDAAPSQPRSRRVVASLAPAAAPAQVSGQAQNDAAQDKAGVYFEPMPLSQLTPQRFVAFGGSEHQKSGR